MSVYLGRPNNKIVQWCFKKYEYTIPLFFEAKTANCTVALMKQGSPDTISIRTSTDGKNWSETDYVFGTDITLTNVGDKVYFKQAGGSGKFSKLASAYYYFKLNDGGTSGEIECHGNIMSLVDETLQKKTIENNYQFTMLFKKCKVLKTSPALPITTLANSCYYNMFYNCTSLTQAPELPATVLANSCYRDMFYNCTSLTQAPELLAIALTDSCYYNMFYNCTSLTQAPALPATTLASYCYSEMFRGCTSLTQAPALPATTLADSCYNSMFYGCTSLTQAPALPATTLASYCYNSMFSCCTSLTQAPEISAVYADYIAYDSEFYTTPQLTNISWPSLTRSDIETLVFNECIFGYDNGYDPETYEPLPTTHHIITYAGGSKVDVYFDEDQYSWVIQDL